MPRKLVALSSAAILSVYAVGYVRTQTTGEQLASTAGAATAQALTGVTTATPFARTPTRSSAVQTPTPTTTRASYRDGTYVGVGTSRHGSIEATVTVSGGQIVETAITACNTRYSCSRISRLLDAVVNAQGTDVNVVSGASDSSRAFFKAVSAALAQAA